MPIGTRHTQKTKRLLSKLRTTHGCSQETKGLKYRTWLAWRMMFQRCYNKNHKSYNDYGGRGIVVCQRWKRFELFLSDMGIKPSGTTLGRLQNNRGYSPRNCEWQTPRQQARNRRSNTFYIFNGQRLTQIEWSEKTGIPRDTLAWRLDSGWPLKMALTLPVRAIKPRKNEKFAYG